MVWKKHESLVSSEPVGGHLSSTQKSELFFWGGDEFFFLEKIYLKIAINVDIWGGWALISGCFSRSGDSFASELPALIFTASGMFHPGVG